MKLSRFVKAQLFAAVYGLFSNMIHPITPTLIDSLALPSYMFGVLFASMSLGMFLSSAFWGRMADKHGRKPVMVISFLGYGLAQIALGYAQDAALMTLLRFVGGLFTSGTLVTMMALVIDASDERSRARCLMYYAAVSSISSSMGFFLGGMLGTLGIRPVFWVHFSGLMLGALLSLLWVKDEGPRGQASAMPRLSLSAMRAMLPRSALLFLLGVALANVGTYGFDNAFNYYLKGALGFGSSVNGVVKAATGLLGLLANLLLNPLIARRMRSGRALVLNLLLCAATLILVALTGGVWPFIAVNVVFYVFNAMYVPVQQAMAGQDKSLDFGLISGLFNMARSLGMIAGSLMAGLLYALNVKLPFAVQAGAFALAALFTWQSQARPRKTAGGE